MKKVTVIGVDLAKSIFHLYCTDYSGKAIERKRVNRQKLLETIGQIPSCKVFMEACGSAHYWARKFQDAGHEVKLIAPQFVKPFLKSNKNDYLDAEAIAEAGTRKNMRFVPIKTVWHQDIMLLHRVRERLIKSRTALCNEIRGFLLEYGVEIPKGRSKLLRELPVLLENRDSLLSPILMCEISELYSELSDLHKKIETYDKKIKLQSKNNDDCRRLEKLKGVGPIVASAIVAATPDPKHFKNGRHFAAWLGLVPRQNSSGGKATLLSISKRGDPYIRKQLIHGCRSTVFRANADGSKTDRWTADLKKRRGYNKATVALANKNARMMWAILTKKEDFKFVA